MKQKNRNKIDYNCGGFALRTYDWYRPYDKQVDYEKFIESSSRKGLSLQEIINIVLSKTVAYMLQEFSNNLRVVEDISEVKNSEECLAYRVCCAYGRDNGKLTPYFDFHFKVFRDGTWCEKCGANSEENTEITNWEHYPYCYNSKTVFLAHKI